MNEMYKYLKEHSYISYNKKSTYEFELSEKRAECIANKYDLIQTQQKEFIKYLEDESKEIYRDGGLRQNILKQVLQKYKSIIGGKE